VKGQILIGNALDALQDLPEKSIQCCCTSPPYLGLRSYKTQPADWPAMEYSPMPGLPAVSVPAMSAELGLESDPFAYVGHLVLIFRELRRVLADDGVFWLNLGDSWTSGGRSARDADDKLSAREMSTRAQTPGGLKPKDQICIPHRVYMALQADGWYGRMDCVWSKKNPMPESVTDRPTKAHEYMFLLSKSERYFYDADAIREENSNPQLTECMVNWRERPNNGEWPAGAGGRMGSVKNGRNKRSVWEIATMQYPESHYAVFPPSLIKPCILSGSRPGDTVIDPFGGSGTTGMVAEQLGRNWILIDAQPENEKLMRERTAQSGLMLAMDAA
jgi:DNA modification methylase